jgi:hypothetical protein
MSDTKYNGWTNYATWRINLEIFDYVNVGDFEGADDAEPNIYEISLQLKDYAEDVIFQECKYDERGQSSLMEDYATAFVQDVNWYEIADHLVKEYIEENQE